MLVLTHSLVVEFMLVMFSPRLHVPFQRISGSRDGKDPLDPRSLQRASVMAAGGNLVMTYIPRLHRVVSKAGTYMNAAHKDESGRKHFQTRCGGPAANAASFTHRLFASH